MNLTYMSCTIRSIRSEAHHKVQRSSVEHAGLHALLLQVSGRLDRLFRMVSEKPSGAKRVTQASASVSHLSLFFFCRACCDLGCTSLHKLCHGNDGRHHHCMYSRKDLKRRQSHSLHRPAGKSTLVVYRLEDSPDCQCEWHRDYNVVSQDQSDTFVNSNA
jgi:hypothetical protein